MVEKTIVWEMRIKMEKIAIDLLWLRPGKVGGTESYIRNLLDGFEKLEEDFDFTLLVSLDNADTFRKYEADKRYRLLTADIKSENIAKRILWQNMFQNRLLRKNGFQKCFEPVYCKPWFNGGIQYTCVIHDLQALHYPKYHPLHEVAYSRLCWRMDALNAARIVAISHWVKSDIERKYHRKDIEVIYNPILVKEDEVEDFASLQKKYNIEKKQFYYTVSQMIPHKNLQTLIAVMDKIVHRKNGYAENADWHQGYGQNAVSCRDLPDKLVISGVNGNAAEELKKQIQDKNLQDAVILTGFVSNEERNSLYQNCHTFLFPSVFEGFGMPPVEAMLFKTRVITTRCASIPEVTQGKAVYVDDPYDIEEWIDKIQDDRVQETMDFGVYAPERIAKQYLAFLKEPIWKKR